MGVELAGEIATDQNSKEKKEVTLLHNGSALLSSRADLKEALGRSLYDQLSSYGVNILLNEKVDFSSLGEGISERTTFPL